MEKKTIRKSKGKPEARPIDELAASQGVRPVMEFDSLLGRPSGEDESQEEFSAMLREWRREGPSPVSQR